MACTLWTGQLSPHQHERECLITLIKKLDSLSEKYYIFANFSVPREIDLAVLKHNAIFIVEIKSKNAFHGVFRPRFNGSWEYLRDDNNFYHCEKDELNYYDQVNQQYFNFKDYLFKFKELFLNPQKASQIKNIYIKTIITINPIYNPAPNADVHEWIKVVGFDKLHEELFINISRGFSLTENEITTLAEKVLNLNRKNVEDLLKPMIVPGEPNWEGYCRNLKKEFEGDEEYFVDPGICEIKVDDKNPHHIVRIPSEMSGILASNQHIVLIGPGGSGKTTYLKHLCSLNARIFLIKKDSTIPLSISLDQYRSESGGLWRLIQNAFSQRGLDNIDDLKVLFYQKTNFLLLFDALEEIDSEELKRAKSELYDLFSCFPSIKRIFAVREKESMRFMADGKEAYLNLFTEDKIQEFLTIYALKIPGFDMEVLKQQINRDFLRLPFHISSLADGWLEYPSFPNPINICIIYDRAISQHIKRELKRQVMNVNHAFDIERLFSQLAFYFYQKRIYRISELQMSNLVEAAFEDLSKKNKISVILTDAINVIDSLPMLKKEDGFVSFEHAYLKEHLAAKELSRRLSSGEGGEDPHLSDLFLKDVLIRTVNFLPDADVFLKELGKKGAYIFLGGFLEGKGGEKAKSFAERFVDKMLKSESQEERFIALKIIGQARNSLYSFSKLLAVLDDEEMRIKNLYKEQMRKCEEDLGFKELSVENIIAPSNDSLSCEDRSRIRKEDFCIYNEAAQYLIKLQNEDNPASFVEIIPKIDNYGVSARGYAVEVLKRLQLPEKNDQIIDFLESRLDESIEQSLLVRGVAYWNLDNPYWEGNPRVESILRKQFEHPAYCDSWVGFPIDIDDLLELNTLLEFDDCIPLPNCIDEIKSLLKNNIEIISENDLSLIYDITNAIGAFTANPYSNDHTDISKTVGLLTLRYFDLGTLPSKDSTFSELFLGKGVKLLGISLCLVSLIASVKKPAAFEFLKKLILSDNAFLSLIGQLGIEILMESRPPAEVIDIYKLQKNEIENSLRLLFENHAVRIINTLSTLQKYRNLNISSSILYKNSLNFAATNNLNYFEIILGLLNKPDLKDIVEDTVLSLLSYHSDHKNILLDILEHIGSSNTAKKLKKQLIGLKIDPDPWNRILELINVLEER